MDMIKQKSFKIKGVLVRAIPLTTDLRNQLESPCPKFNENDSFVSSTINHFSDYDCWQFIKDIILDFEKEKEKWNKYIELCILNTEDRRKMKNKIEKKNSQNIIA